MIEHKPPVDDPVRGVVAVMDDPPDLDEIDSRLPREPELSVVDPGVRNASFSALEIGFAGIAGIAATVA